MEQPPQLQPRPPLPPVTHEDQAVSAYIIHIYINIHTYVYMYAATAVVAPAAAASCGIRRSSGEQRYIDII